MSTPDVENGQYYDVRVKADSPCGKDNKVETVRVSCNSIIEELCMSFHVGNAFAYIWRAGNKPNNPAVDDLKKAVWHLQHEIEILEGK